MFRPVLNSLMLGSLVLPFIATAGSSAQGGIISFHGEIVEPPCEVSAVQTDVEMTCMQNAPVHTKLYSSKGFTSGVQKNLQIASVKMQYLNEQKTLAVMSIEYK